MEDTGCCCRYDRSTIPGPARFALLLAYAQPSIVIAYSRASETDIYPRVPFAKGLCSEG